MSKPTDSPDKSDIRNSAEFKQAFEQHLKLDSLIAQISYNLIHFITTGNNSVIDEALQKLGEAFGADRSYMVFLDEDKTKSKRIHEWCAPDIPPHHKSERNLKLSDLKWWIEKLSSQGAVHISRVAELSSVASDEKMYLQEQGVRSCLAVPLVYSRSPLGFFGLDAIQSDRTWTEDEIATLKVIGEILANALEHRQVEEALRESEARFKALIQNSTDVITILSPDGTIQFLSPSVEKVADYKLEELIGKTIFEFVHPEDIEFVTADLLRLLREPSYSVPIVYRFRHANGSWIYLESIPQNLLDNPNIQGIVVNTRDVTRRMQTEVALRENQAWLELLLAATPAVLFSMEAETDFPITYMSENSRVVVGHEAREFIENPKYWAAHIHPEDCARVCNDMSHLFEQNHLCHEYRFLHGDGTYRWLYNTLRLVQDENGRSGRIFGSTIDITERKKAEEELRQAEAKNRALLDAIPDEIFRFNREGIFLEVRSHNPQDLILPAELLLGQNVTNLLPPKIAQGVMPYIKQALDTGQVQVVEYGMLVAGEQHYFEARIIALGKDEILTILRDITKRKEAEKVLERRMAFEKLVAQISASFINLTSQETSVAINQALEAIGTLYNADCCYIFLASDDGSIVRGAYEWNSEGMESQHILLQEASIKALSWWLEQMTKRKVINVPSVQDLGEEAAKEKALLQQHNIQALLLIPLICGQQIIGSLGLDSIKVERTWTEEEIINLKVLGEIFSSTLIRQQMEQEIRESEERYRFLAENASDLIVRADLEGNLTYVSPASRTILGYEPEEMVGHPGLEFFSSEEMNKIINLLIDSPETITTSVPVLRKDGRIIWLEIAIRSLRDPQTKAFQQAVAVGRDITERKKYEEALRESEELYHSLFDNNLYGVILANPNGKIAAANPAACQILGYEEKEIIALGRDGTLDQNDPRLPAYMKKRRLTRTIHAELNFVRKDGKIIPCELARGRYTDKSGQERSCVVFKDITERKKYEEERLKNSNLESLGMLAGGIAHDYNNILTAIMGNISLARLSLDMPEDLDSMLDEAEKATFRARELTQQLLTFARGGAPIKRMARLEELIRDTTSFVLRGSNVRSELYLPSGLWSVEIDRGQISQVFQNLVLNSIQAMPEGGVVRIEARNVELIENEVPLLNPGKYLKIAVLDQGSGIKPEDLTHIFDPYFTTKTMGNGLGLAVCYSIIKKHEGRIVVESTWGRGTAAHVYLPVVSGTVSDVPTQKTVALPRYRRVLVMDDEAMVRELLSKLLPKLGYEAELVRDGAEALERYRKAKDAGQPFDLVIMDLTIPGGMGGKEAIKKLLALDPEAKAVVSSGYSYDPVMANWMEYGFKGVISKPYNLATLEQALGKILR